MSRANWKQGGKFNVDQQTNRIENNIRAYRQGHGDWLDYYHLNEAASEFDDVFEEAIGAGRAYYPPFHMPAVHVYYYEGANKEDDKGYYWNDTLEATIDFQQYIDSGLDFADLLTGNYERDRVVYRNKLFRVTKVAIEGQIQQRNTIVQLNATQLKPDEIVDDPEFKQWSA